MALKAYEYTSARVCIYFVRALHQARSSSISNAVIFIIAICMFDKINLFKSLFGIRCCYKWNEKRRYSKRVKFNCIHDALAKLFCSVCRAFGRCLDDCAKLLQPNGRNDDLHIYRTISNFISSNLANGIEQSFCCKTFVFNDFIQSGWELVVLSCLF